MRPYKGNVRSYTVGAIHESPVPEYEPTKIERRNIYA